MIGASSQDILFTSGGTESNNLVVESAFSLFKDTQPDHEKPHVITSTVEHDSIENVLRDLEERGIIDVTRVQPDNATFAVTVQDVIKAVRASTCLVTIMLANNETGVIQPIGEISRAVHEFQHPNAIPVHTDAAQVQISDSVSLP